MKMTGAGSTLNQREFLSFTQTTDAIYRLSARQFLSILLTTIFLSSGAGHAASLSYNQIDENLHELILTTAFSLEVPQAQNALIEPALQICNGRMPRFGNYEFESTEPAGTADGEESFVFTQEITCTDELVTQSPRKPFELSAEQEKQLGEKAKLYAIEYLTAKQTGNLDTAYQMLSSQMQQFVTINSWKEQESEYYSTVGDVTSYDVWRTTVYNNPADSPEPGLYIATDYENLHENGTISCGYVISYLPEPDATTLVVMREERGNISTEISKKLSAEELKNVRNQFGCKQDP